MTTDTLAGLLLVQLVVKRLEREGGGEGEVEGGGGGDGFVGTTQQGSWVGTALPFTM